MYFYVVVWLCLLGTEVSASPRCVEILDAGLLPVVKDHIGIHFFVTVINRGPEATEVEVTMVQCCEEFPGSSTECSHIHLIPETRILDVGKTRNFTLIYPTLYPYNRRGECLLSVHYMTSCNRSKEARQHIAFDTTLSDDNVKCHVLRGFPGYVMEQPLCKSYDEDALDSCKMVDCHKKYFGLRSYFNRGTRVCEPVPACLPSKRRGMPDTVYDVTVNRCADMTGCLSEDDLQHLSHADLEPECVPSYSSRMAFLNCHYGRLSNDSGDCICESGYARAPMPEEPGNPRTQVFHSCNVDNSCWSWDRFMMLPDRAVLLVALFLAIIIAILALCLVRE
ncbi:uncharacterized protein LOC124365224 isoform X1 [Homalodisca vitripennis]|uniref:uncharacterized protein LOC124365224 isoform X1 n=1 Tax=Homalodisca vitripennis TaxID=197043 RepID=UPI001EECE238|nr:uncharacterized protein LOC124365224 isoform X1 [Homalodisca vitripennis]XP_046677143.1 uncharacterized protein LOC124365224 isoform X1 [Homalodisca vitripennis]KAG8252390.1 hypothetical protein J6590_057811 [Homalodisca vitripennis]